MREEYGETQGEGSMATWHADADFNCGRCRVRTNGNHASEQYPNIEEPKSAQLSPNHPKEHSL